MIMKPTNIFLATEVQIVIQLFDEIHLRLFRQSIECIVMLLTIFFYSQHTSNPVINNVTLR